MNKKTLNPKPKFIEYLEVMVTKHKKPWRHYQNRALFGSSLQWVLTLVMLVTLGITLHIKSLNIPTRKLEG